MRQTILPVFLSMMMMKLALRESATMLSGCETGVRCGEAIGPQRRHVVEVQIVRRARRADELQLIGREAELPQMIGRQPFPDDVALGRDLVHGVVQHPGKREPVDTMEDVDQDQRVAVGQAAQVMMLTRFATRRRHRPNAR